MLKLAKRPDRTPVKVAVTLNPDLHRTLRDYAALYRAAYGDSETVADLIPYMLASFLDGDRENDNAPAFRVLAGNSRVGDAWEACNAGDNPKPYWRVHLDDPALPAPFTAALFPADDGTSAQLVWNRRRGNREGEND